jgi:hypothetical protein
MGRSFPALIIVLGGLGLLPFLAGFYLQINQLDWLAFSGRTLFMTYSAIILSFMSGALWGQSLEHSREVTLFKLPIITNVIALLAWLCLLFNQSSLAIGVLFSGYLLLLLTEWYWREQGDFPNGYYPMLRLLLTSIVCVLHFFMLLND